MSNWEYVFFFFFEYEERRKPNEQLLSRQHQVNSNQPPILIMGRLSDAAMASGVALPPCSACFR